MAGTISAAITPRMPAEMKIQSPRPVSSQNAPPTYEARAVPIWCAKKIQRKNIPTDRPPKGSAVSLDMGGTVEM
jgi:hypothetical protein